MLKIILTLLLIQSARIVAVQMLLQVSNQAMLYESFLLIPIGILLYLIFHPKVQSLGLGIKQMSKKEKKCYIVSTLVVGLLALSTPELWMEPSLEVVISIIKSVLIYPIFEELIFRGYIWNKLENCRIKDKKLKGPYLIILTAVLFGIWHLGYVDVIYIRTTTNFLNSNIYSIMFYKVFVGMAFGVFTGLARWKTKSTYSSILIHGFLNIFGK